MSGEAFLLTVGAFLVTVQLLCLQSLRPLLDALSHCKQKSFPTVSKKAEIVSKKAPIVSKKAKVVNSNPGRTYIRPPPLPPFLAKRHFPVEGGGGVYFEAPRGRNFIRPPPPPPFIHPPPLGGYFQGWGGGGVGVYKIRPRM